MRIFLFQRENGPAKQKCRIVIVQWPSSKVLWFLCPSKPGSIRGFSWATGDDGRWSRLRLAVPVHWRCWTLQPNRNHYIYSSTVCRQQKVYSKSKSSLKKQLLFLRSACTQSNLDRLHFPIHVEIEKKGTAASSTPWWMSQVPALQCHLLKADLPHGKQDPNLYRISGRCIAWGNIRTFPNSSGSYFSLLMLWPKQLFQAASRQTHLIHSLMEEKGCSTDCFHAFLFECG